MNDTTTNDNLVTTRVSDSIGTITMNRAGRRNALSRQMIHALKQALFDMNQQRRIRSVVLTGAGSVFCAGMDLHEICETVEMPDAESQWQADAEAFQSLLQDMCVYPKPIVAAVNGDALGGGVGLVLACDIVLAVESSRVAVPAPQRGLVAGLIAPLFAFRVGAGHTARYMLTGEAIDAQESHRIGIFHELFAGQEKMDDRLQALGEHFAKCSYSSIAMTKRLINEEIGAGLRAQLAVGAAMTATSKTTEAGREGVRAFVEKRAPNWP